MVITVRDPCHGIAITNGAGDRVHVRSVERSNSEHEHADDQHSSDEPESPKVSDDADGDQKPYHMNQSPFRR